MTAPFVISDNAELAAKSSYAQSLEYVAPGIVPIIDRLAVYGQPWYESLQQNVFSINATSEQKEILIALSERAKSGQPPPTNEELFKGSDVKPAPDIKKLIGGIGALITLANILG